MSNDIESKKPDIETDNQILERKNQTLRRLSMKRQKNKDLNRLSQYARLFHVEKKIKTYLEILL